VSGVPLSDPNFYRLAFASQMIVWATRKRLHLLARGEDDSNVVQAFRLGGLQDLYTALMAIVDVLLCGVSTRIQLHSVSCPCLSPHETSLLNALAYLQHGRGADARRCMGDLMCAAAVRLVLPAMRAIVHDLNAQELRLTLIEVSSASPQPAGNRFSTAIH
jgi:hypothetical protein